MGEYLQRAYDRRLFNGCILAHRGYWLEEAEKIPRQLFKERLITVRDIKGEFVLSHDMPQGGEMPFYAGMSDITPSPVLLEKAKGIWLDSFYTDWFGEKEIQIY